MIIGGKGEVRGIRLRKTGEGAGDEVNPYPYFNP
jgi:hypothetical protein